MEAYFSLGSVTIGNVAVLMDGISNLFVPICHGSQNSLYMLNRNRNCWITRGCCLLQQMAISCINFLDHLFTPKNEATCFHSWGRWARMFHFFKYFSVIFFFHSYQQLADVFKYSARLFSLCSVNQSYYVKALV